MNAIAKCYKNFIIRPLLSSAMARLDSGRQGNGGGLGSIKCRVEILDKGFHH
jgi:hypothetical protein